MKKIITIIKSVEAYNIPTKAEDFLEFWQDQISGITEEYRDSIEIEYDASCSYDCPHLSAALTYKRIETDEEEMKRESDESAKRYMIEQRELKQLEQLKAKYK